MSSLEKFKINAKSSNPETKKSSSNQSPHDITKYRQVLPLCTKLTKEGVTFSRQRGEKGLAEPSTNNTTRTPFPPHSGTIQQPQHTAGKKHAQKCARRFTCYIALYYYGCAVTGSGREDFVLRGT